MKKIYFIIIFIFVISFTINIKALDINSKYATIYNLNDNEIVYSKNSNEIISIASLTKIMTSIVAIENIQDINAKVMVPYGTNDGLIEQNAARVDFFEGGVVTYSDLLHGALLPSGADATRALAILISGSETEFANLMNKKAKEIGMKNTNFVNSSGLDTNNHYSTIDDLLILLKYSLKNETFKKIYETKSYTSSDNNFYMESTVEKSGKRFNIDVSHIKGSKTGFTYDAGYCLASELVLSDTTFLVITAGSPIDDKPYHIIDFNTIYNYLNDSYSMRDILKTNALALTLKPEYSKEKEIKFYTNKTITKFIKNDEEIKIDYVYNGKENLFGNEKKGTHLGYIDVVYKNKVIDTIDVILNQDLTFDYFKYLKQYWYFVPIAGILTFLIIFGIIKYKKHKNRLI